MKLRLALFLTFLFFGWEEEAYRLFDIEAKKDTVVIGEKYQAKIFISDEF